MADEKGGSFGLIGEAWERAKMYQGSNAIARYDGIIVDGSVKTLGNFVRQPGKGLEFGLDFDSRQDERLEKYNIAKMIPTKRLEEFENPNEVYVITDAQGHDIGTLALDKDGNMEFKLNPKIKEANDKILSHFPEYQRDAIEKECGIKDGEMDFSAVVDRLSKGESIALYSTEQVRSEFKDTIEKSAEERGEIFSATNNATDEKAQEEADALENVPMDMRASVMEKCKEQGLKVKEVIIVDCPEHVADQLEDARGISPNGEPLILVKTASTDGSIDDDVFVAQGESELMHNEVNDDILGDLMEQHKDEGHVEELEDEKGELLRELIEQIQRKREAEIQAEEEKMAEALAELEQYSDPSTEFEDEEVREEAIASCEARIAECRANIGNIYHSTKHEIEVLLDNYDRKDIAIEASQEEQQESYEHSATQPDEDLDNSSNVEEQEEPDEGMYKNRWDTANPFYHN